MAETVQLSVRGLAEYACRGGSIEAGFRLPGSMAEGTKIHKGIQAAYPEPDRSEVFVQGELEQEGILFRLEGRCDGIRYGGEASSGEPGLVTVEEIKSTSGDLRLIEEDSFPAHWAQAVCYAYLFSRSEGLDRMGIRLLYVQADSGEERRFERTAGAEELERQVRALLSAYVPYARLQLRHAERRTASIKALPFPYGSYRPGQRHLAGAVYKTAAEGRRLFARAPTGTGKTISTLFPAVKAIGEDQLRRVFYLTARTTTRAAAEEALARMEEHGLRLRSVTLTAKEKICFQEEVRCTSEACPYADGYYDRINGALLDMLERETRMTRGVVERYARKHRVCPFEMSLDAAYAADAVIGDYNYVYDPRIALKRLWEEDKRRTAVLVDEAHNLADRAREMYSAELAKGPFLALQRLFKGRSEPLYRAAKAVNGFFIALRKEQDGRQGIPPRKEAPSELLPLLEEFVLQAERELAAGNPGGDGEGAELLQDVYYAAQNFIRIAGLYDERYVTYAEEENRELRLKLFCLDPSHLLRQTSKGYRAQIFFSATLSPLGFYRELLGGDAEDYTVSIPSPFRKEQLQVRLLPLSTRYRDREATYTPIAALLQERVRLDGGNLMVFFPSYEYMKEVHTRFMERVTAAQVLLQEPGMAEEERDRFLGEFRADAERPVIGFAVMGGIFSEGIDLAGDRLTGVVVVGVGLPQLGTERNLIKDYYDSIGKSGFEYAYVYPGMNKVLQAGGRLIRTEEDRGTLVLVDDRFRQPGYLQLLPEEWKPLDIMGEGAGRMDRSIWRKLYE
ncbi:ATP-dependent DNA helicase [Gorillibacterium sp. sgz5001074]|uniref:ATP-dependent DNA helicase n=1 Tax=Gorillibacterium sp. sgz5001074 TaxID=3446695 RepID=UPI003F66779E